MKNRDDDQRKLKMARFKREIGILLHGSLREEEWENLIEEHFVEELLSGILSSSEVADIVRKRREVYGQRGEKKPWRQKRRLR